MISSFFSHVSGGIHGIASNLSFDGTISFVSNEATDGGMSVVFA